MAGINNDKTKKPHQTEKQKATITPVNVLLYALLCFWHMCGKACKLHKNPRFG